MEIVAEVVVDVVKDEDVVVVGVEKALEDAVTEIIVVEADSVGVEAMVVASVVDLRMRTPSHPLAAHSSSLRELQLPLG